VSSRNARSLIPSRREGMYAILGVIVGSLLALGVYLTGSDGPGHTARPQAAVTTTTAPPSSSAATQEPDPAPTGTAAPPTASDLSARSPGTRACPPVPRYPTPACTGVPPRLKLKTINGDLNANRPGQRINGRHITGSLLISADGVTITNSRIDGQVTNGSSGPVSHSFTISDSTVGTSTACTLQTGISQSRFTATRVLVQGHGDGFGDAGDDILIQDSFVRLCGSENAHSDGVQGYQGGRNVIVRHNTIDQRAVPASGQTAPIFFSDGSKDATVLNNLLMGGSETLRVHDGGGHYVVRGNRVVKDAWIYGPVNSDCHAISAWSDNRLVTIDDSYRVTSLGAHLACGG
jgi:hypothetical protein